MSENAYQIEHNSGKKRFIISVDGREAGYCSYVPREDGVLVFNHTVVDQAFRGQGLSSPLIKAALDEVRAQGKKIIPACSAVEYFLNKHKSYQDLIAER